MNGEIAKALIGAEMQAFESARRDGDTVSAWRALERAHIVSQLYLALHLSNHWRMFKFAFEQRDSGEMFGQLVRLALAPIGALTERIPVGNTGRSNVSAFQPMPVPEDIRIAMKTKPRG